MTGHEQPLEHLLAATLARYAARPDTRAIRFALSSPARQWSWQWPAQAPTQPYFIASITKLYVSALIMQLRHEGRVDLDRAASDYLDPAVMAGIHVRRGVDAGPRITISELLAHTSGIADYFEERGKDGTSQFERALARDCAWSFADVVRITKTELASHFAPSTPGKAFYSDTNYQLLGAVIEAVTRQSFESALHARVIAPLGLAHTYPFSHATLARYDDVAPMLYGRDPVRIPLAMMSVRADGGIVSTADDGLTFLEAFMTGRLFPANDLEEMQRTWRRIFFPLEYGVGIMRFALPSWMTGFRRVPPMIGHSGASGAVLFHVPDLDLYVSGTVNQIRKRSLSFELTTRLVMACGRAWRVP